MGNITVLLGDMRVGNAAATSELYAQVYAELTRIARNRLAGGQHYNLDAPSLVHEAYLRLAQQELPSLRDRRDFFAYAATVMRTVVIDTIRQLNSQKRGSGITPLTLSNADAHLGTDTTEVESLQGALEQLAQVDPRGHRIVEMRYFGGMTNEEIAEVLEISTVTVKRNWQSARAFLLSELQS